MWPRLALILLLVHLSSSKMVMDETSCHEVEEEECGLCHTVYMEECSMKEVEEQAASGAEAEVDVPKGAGVGAHLEA